MAMTLFLTIWEISYVTSGFSSLILLDSDKDTKMCMWKESVPIGQKSFLVFLVRKKEALRNWKFHSHSIGFQVEDLLILSNYSHLQSALVWAKFKHAVIF